MVFKKSNPPVVIKKYGNRRLYDTRESRYVTLVEVAELVKQGEDVRVVDAKGGADLTQAILVQIILDGRGAAKLLPVGLLVQLIRMEEEALADFLGRYMSWALELYNQAKQGAQAIAPWNPLAAVPFSAANTVAQLLANAAGWAKSGQAQPAPSNAGGANAGVEAEDGAPLESEAQESTGANPELAELRRELQDLKRSLADLTRTASGGRGRKT